jgi:hypothetical protein
MSKQRVEHTSDLIQEDVEIVLEWAGRDLGECGSLAYDELEKAEYEENLALFKQTRPFIVQACNAHDALVEACHYAFTSLNASPRDLSSPTLAFRQKARKLIRAALALATTDPERKDGEQ